MDKSSIYYRQVSLLIRCIPFVSSEDCFALKGGTAINLFIQDFPRLSVDIDLVYLPLDTRSKALTNIRNALHRIAEQIKNTPGLSAALQDNKLDEMRIIVDSDDKRLRSAQIKIEVSPVARGTIHKPQIHDVVSGVEDEFGFASIKVVSLPDLYGGKLCAAMDRQHPRDLFDVRMLLNSEGIDREMFNGYIAYLLSHNRPISEVMNPRWKNISAIYKNEFIGMTFEQVSLDDLIQTQTRMTESLHDHFTQRDYDFLISFKIGDPDWSLSPNDNIQKLPAVKWKLLNIKNMSEKNRQESLVRLETVLSDWLAQS